MQIINLYFKILQKYKMSLIQHNILNILCCISDILYFCNILKYKMSLIQHNITIYRYTWLTVLSTPDWSRGSPGRCMWHWDLTWWLQLWCHICSSYCQGSIESKRKRSDSVLWLKPQHPQKTPNKRPKGHLSTTCHLFDRTTRTAIFVWPANKFGI